ncbi:MAG: hypothetical protein WC761_06355 [Candidatus Paceibacterota bacterium]|jgi:hypothetical protein
MKLWAITHGQKHEGVNPSLTQAGIEQIANASRKLIDYTVTGVVIGTGKRFIDTHAVYRDTLGEKKVPIKYSPFLGSADSGKKAETGFDVVLADGTPIHDSGYIGLIGTPGVDLWAVLEGTMKDGTLLVTGREFIGAFMPNGANDAKSATVYEIDTATRTVTEIK